MFSAINTAVSGLHASARRVEASASNIANARDSIPTEDARVTPVREASRSEEEGERPVYEPVGVSEESVEGGGVRSEYVPYDPPHVEVYAPDDARADEDGVVARPNVDYATELVNTRRAETAYRANIETIRTADDMLGSLLDRET